jgi:hypothetical protein
MTKISQYAVDTVVTGSDKWIGSDSQFYNATKNFTPDKLAKYFNENQVIDTGANLRMRYVVLDVGEERPFGSITFNPQQGATVPFSSISNFLMSDKNTAGALVPNFIEFLQDTKVFISKTRDLNTFGYYKVISVEEYLPEPDFYTVTVEFISGNGSLTKDVNYVISFVSDMSDNGPIYTFTSPLVNTSDVISIGQSSSMEDGYLSSADWNVFNNKQDEITLTTTNNSGASTLASGVLNIPNYTLLGLGGQPLATNLTSLSGLTYSSASFVKMTAAGTFALDTNTYLTTAVTSVGMTVPSAFNVTPSTITSSGTFAITGAGSVSQYVRGDGSLANFPNLSGGGASVSYYLNGSVSQGTIGGVAYKEMNSVPVIGAGTDFTINTNGYIAQFITDAGDPNKLLIP